MDEFLQTCQGLGRQGKTNKVSPILKITSDDTTLMAESEEELKSLLMKVKEESEKLA